MRRLEVRLMSHDQRLEEEVQRQVAIAMFTIAYGTAMPTQLGDVYHGQQIPAGYTRVGVEQVCQGWETLELDIPRGGGERTLAEAIHGYILWDKRYIVLKSDDQTPRPASQQNSPRAALSRQGSPAHSPWSPPPPPAKKQKQPPAKKVAAPAKEPPKKKEKKKKNQGGSY